MSAPVGTLVSLALSLLQGRVPTAILAEVRRFLEALEGRIADHENRIAGLEKEVAVLKKSIGWMVAARRAAKLSPERLDE